MICLKDKDSGTTLGTISEQQLQFLRDQLEEIRASGLYKGERIITSTDAGRVLCSFIPFSPTMA